MSGLRLLGVLRLTEVQKWRHILGDQRFSRVLGYLSTRIVEDESLGVFDKQYGSELNSDIRLIIEYLHDITSKSKKTKEKFITIKEYDQLCDSLLSSSIEPLTRVTNFSDIYNFLMVKKFGEFPADLMTRTLLFKTKHRYREECEAIAVEFFKNNLRVDVLDDGLKIEDTRGHALDLVIENPSDNVLFDNNITQIVETNQKKLLSPMVNVCFENDKNIAGVLRNPRTTRLFEEITGSSDYFSKHWHLSKFDAEILKYVLVPGSFTRLFRDENNGIARQYLYFMPFHGESIWRINNYHIMKKFSVLGNAIRDISIIPIINRITHLIRPQVSIMWEEALLKNQMRWHVNVLRTRRIDRPIGEDIDIEGEFKNKELQKHMLKSSKIIKKSYDPE
ncbi:MAG: hypothetical protein ACTSRW_03380 [Candidatus Helarchaeota archaeon]